MAGRRQRAVASLDRGGLLELAIAGIEFIDGNRGGPGVRLRKLSGQKRN